MAIPSAKTRALLLRPLKTTKMTRMAGVAHAKKLFPKNPVFFFHPRTKECYSIRGVSKSEFSGSQKKGGIKGAVKREKWWESEQGLKGKEGENEGKRVGGKGPESTPRKTLILVPL